MKKVVHYINQFFAGIGGEELADIKPEIRKGAVGPGTAFKDKLDAEIAYTIVCGDNYFGSNTEEAIEEIFNLLNGIEFDAFIAGPAFQAGRYGIACGNIAKAVKEKFDIPVVTSMHVENPGVEMFKEDIVIFKGGNSAASMRNDIKPMSEYLNKIFKGEETNPAEEEGYFSRGIRKQVWLKEPVTAAKRGVDMLIKKLNNQPYQTELVIESREEIPMATPIKDLKTANIAIVTSGGIVPVDNPDRIQSASATRWGAYDISNVDRLDSGVFKTIHAGYDPEAADNDPNRVVPIDVLKEMNKNGIFGKLHSYFYSTVGTGTTQAEAARMAKEIIIKLQEDSVDGVIMTST